MTIIEAIKEVLKSESKGLSSAEIYQKIIDQNLYQFGAKNPDGVVNGEIRRHCIGLDFPTAYPVGLRGMLPTYPLYKPWY